MECRVARSLLMSVSLRLISGAFVLGVGDYKEFAVVVNKTTLLNAYIV